MATSAHAQELPTQYTREELQKIVKPADIIVSRTEGATSGVIQKGTCGKYSHAILALHSGMCIEAVGSGVEKNYLDDVLSKKTFAALYRRTTLTPISRNAVCKHALAQYGKKYDSIGAANSGIYSGCGGVWFFSGVGQVINGAEKVTRNQQDLDDKFFCSELIARSFEKAGVPLFKRPAHMVTPSLIPLGKHIDLVQVLHDVEYT